jgi:hypothetical protein
MGVECGMVGSSCGLNFKNKLKKQKQEIGSSDSLLKEFQWNLTIEENIICQKFVLINVLLNERHIYYI